MGIAGDGEVAVAVDAAAAVVEAMALAALRCFDGAALNVDGNIFATAAAADACAAIAADASLMVPPLMLMVVVPVLSSPLPMPAASLPPWAFTMRRPRCRW